jgi:mannosyltransferase
MTRKKKNPTSFPQTKHPISTGANPGEALPAGTFSTNFIHASWHTLLPPLAILAIGLALRLYHLGEFSVWIDEANTVRIASMGFDNMIDALSRDSSPPLYYLLLRLWMFFFGEGPIAIRLLSVLFSTILIGYVFIVGRRFFSYRTGLVAALLMAVAPAQILHAQQCRMYTLLPLFALGAFHCLKNASDTGSRIWLAGWIACMIGAIYTHNYGWFLFPACLWILCFNGALRQYPLRWIGAAAVIGIVFLPWSPIFWQQLHISAQNSWFQPIWDYLGPHGNFFYTLDSFSGGRKSLSFQWAKPDPVMIPRLLVFIAASIWAVFMAVRKDSNVNIKNNLFYLLAFLMIPLITTLLLSLTVSPIYRFGRSDQLVFPFFILLTAVGVATFRKPALFLVLTVVLTVFSLANYPPLTAHASMRGDVNMSEKILKLAKPGDVVLATSLTIGPLAYYARQAQVRLAVITFPRDDIRHPAIRDDAAWFAKPGALEKEASAVMSDACKMTGSEGRILALLGREEFNIPLFYLFEQRNSSRIKSLPGIYPTTMTNRPVQLFMMTCP